ncbi:SDR family NAD(P)-dependent oxidoreductase [Psychrobacter sp. LV10R520-6]|uniref:SDR family NAD(P)-dependent oxidoreductase n=1 Tax=Psychrobacter sp. LV10R520-6 TaxID=1415574 RepID=UPI0024C6530D|nr:SDR family oxidoreductase [Psychrobacter sp. LV10R520-6]SNT70997.1 meso-butanediol dehydrogenase / (S,S)-butanediol dehydrogenase / diacetyl reductase [Psychrobacter sp. LV10R520-6]
MKRFREKTVIVTGAGSGIGRATAIRFANEGASVVLVGRTAETLKETAKEFPEDRTWIHNDNYLTVICDISDQSQVQEMVRRVVEKFDQIDVLVNNAGKATQGKITELSAEDWKSSIDVNLNGTFYVCQAAMPHLIATKGNIVNVSSLSGVGGDWNMAAYNAAKAGVSNLTRTLALDHGPDGVRVNAVNPSITETNMTSAIQDSETKTNNFLDRCPLGRLATPDDIAAAITFLASDDASMITGVNLPVDGGVSASNGQPQF